MYIVQTASQLYSSEYYPDHSCDSLTINMLCLRLITWRSPISDHVILFGQMKY